MIKAAVGTAGPLCRLAQSVPKVQEPCNLHVSRAIVQATERQVLNVEDLNSQGWDKWDSIGFSQFSVVIALHL
jgi:hypothetical protein